METVPSEGGLRLTEPSLSSNTHACTETQIRINTERGKMAKVRKKQSIQKEKVKIKESIRPAVLHINTAVTGKGPKGTPDT